MIEMLGVLAIIGILSAGGIMGYSTAMDNHKVNQTIDDVNILVANVTGMFGKPSKSEQAEYITGGRKFFCNLGLAPEYICKHKLNDNEYTSRFGRAAGIYFNYSKTLTYLHMGFTGLNKSQCIKLASYNWWGKSPKVRVYIQEKSSMSYGAAAVRAIRRDNTPISPSEANSFCQLTSGVTLAVEMVFYINGEPSS